MTKNQRRAAKIALRIASHMIKTIRTKGYAIPLPKRTPKLVRYMVKKVLVRNGFKVKPPLSNPAVAHKKFDRNFSELRKSIRRLKLMQVTTRRRWNKLAKLARKKGYHAENL